MDNLIAGVLSAALFAAFAVGLAESIGAVPFMIIVGIVLVFVVTDLVQSVKKGFTEKSNSGGAD